MPPSIVAMVFNYLLNPSNGAINEFLLSLHLIQTPINFFQNGLTGFTTIAFISAWQIMGQYIIFWMAALQSIPDELYEAADLDGASAFDRMRYITPANDRPHGHHHLAARINLGAGYLRLDPDHDFRRTGHPDLHGVLLRLHESFCENAHALLALPALPASCLASPCWPRLPSTAA